MAEEDRDATDDFWGSAGSRPLNERLQALRFQQAINGFPKPGDDGEDGANDSWFGV